MNLIDRFDSERVECLLTTVLLFLDSKWMGTRGIGADTDFSQQDQAEGFAQGISDLTNFFSNAMA